MLTSFCDVNDYSNNNSCCISLRQHLGEIATLLIKRYAYTLSDTALIYTSSTKKKNPIYIENSSKLMYVQLYAGLHGLTDLTGRRLLLVRYSVVVY